MNQIRISRRNSSTCRAARVLHAATLVSLFAGLAACVQAPGEEPGENNPTYAIAIEEKGGDPASAGEGAVEQQQLEGGEIDVVGPIGTDVADSEMMTGKEAQAACGAGDEFACSSAEVTREASGPLSLTDDCRSYYGKCTSWGGMSCANGEGWSICYTGKWLYAWMTICGAHGSVPSSGHAPCAL